MVSNANWQWVPMPSGGAPLPRRHSTVTRLPIGTRTNAKGPTLANQPPDQTVLSPASATGSPAAFQASKPPIMSVASVTPMSMRVAAARLDAYPS